MGNGRGYLLRGSILQFIRMVQITVKYTKRFSLFENKLYLKISSVIMHTILIIINMVNIKYFGDLSKNG